jgi:monoamine oxidase
MMDAVIIGAGVCGLCTARLLEQAGLRTQVIESRARVGGRTWSPHIQQTPMDLGASWVWSNERDVLNLLEELGVHTFEAAAQGIDLVEQQGRVIPTRQPSSWSPERRMVGGAQALCLKLAEHIPRQQLDTPVTRITSHPEHLEVHTAGRTWRARHVVAALPPALCAASIDIPALPKDVVLAMRHTPTWMEQFAKVAILFETPFWREEGLSGRAFSDRGPMREIHDISPPDASNKGVLFGFVPGPLADIDALEADARAQLIRLFGPQAGAPIQVVHHAWWSDPHTVPVGERVHTQQQLFGHAMWRSPRLEGRLHFASTETAAHNTGHIDGAVHRAHQVARTILDAWSEPL